MEKFAGGYTALYQQEDMALPVRSVLTHVTPFRVNNDVRSESDMEAAVRRLCLNKSGVNTHLRTEHFKKWMWEAYPSEGTSTPPKSGEVVEAYRTYTVHVVAGGDTNISGMEDLSPHPQGQQRHLVDQPAVDTVEVGRGNY